MCNITSIEKVELSLCDEHGQSFRDIANKFGINKDIVRLIIATEDLGMTKVNAKVAPKNLTSNQKLTCICNCEDWLENWDNFDKEITRDKSWSFEYDPKTKR